ncbi:hypothetical protein GG344DRAFT_65265 [Lentinula edodes]|nr:hypothetical protein GG344DRAFT_65265 [Lentinula edodes]
MITKEQVKHSKKSKVIGGITDQTTSKSVRYKRKNDEWKSRVELLKFEGPECWRMTWSEHNGECNSGSVSEPQEVVFHMQGVIEEKCLPPLKRQSEKTMQKARHTRQWIVISGLGSVAFDNDCEGIMEVYAMFARALNGLACVEFKNVNNRRAVELGNRMFTPRNQAPEMEWVDIDRQVDMHGAMHRVRNSDLGLVHGEENVVLYGEEFTSEEGKKRYRREQQNHFEGEVAAPIGNTIRWKVHAANAGKQEWIKAKAMAQVNVGTTRKQLKKRVFDDDEVEGTRKKFQMMSTSADE